MQHHTPADLYLREKAKARRRNRIDWLIAIAIASAIASAFCVAALKYCP